MTIKIKTKAVLFVSLLTLAGVATPLQGLSSSQVQHEHHDKNRPERITPEEATEKIAKELGLSNKQKKELLKLNREYASLIGNRYNNGKPMPAEVKEVDTDTLTDRQLHIHHQHIKRNEYIAKLRLILTKEQMEKYLRK